MVIKYSRAQRRHDRQRMTEHVKRLYMYQWWKRSVNWNEEKDKRGWYGRVRDNAVICSCPMCGNPRRNGWEDPLTVAERRADAAFKDGVEELITKDLPV